MMSIFLALEVGIPAACLGGDHHLAVGVEGDVVGVVGMAQRHPQDAVVGEGGIEAPVGHEAIDPQVLRGVVRIDTDPRAAAVADASRHDDLSVGLNCELAALAHQVQALALDHGDTAVAKGGIERAIGIEAGDVEPGMVVIALDQHLAVGLHGQCVEPLQLGTDLEFGNAVAAEGRVE
jgi:hypothetical protein